MGNLRASYRLSLRDRPHQPRLRSLTPREDRGAVRRRAASEPRINDAAGAEFDARRLGWALVPVRLFLGVTFVYGGIQKLSDPGFLHPGAPTYIGTQLRGFAHATPGGFLLRAFAIPHPVLAGVGMLSKSCL